MKLVDLFVLILATFRISNLFVSESGPYNIFGKFRKFVGIIEIEVDNGEIVNEVLDSNNEIGKLFSCLWCLSIYVSFILMFIPKKLLLPFAISAGAIFVKEYKNGM